MNSPDQGAILVLLPTYNNDGTLARVIREVRSVAPSILVVNDGSTDRTADILADQSGISVLQLMPNQGKGAALMAGFCWARDQGFRTVVTFDTDGQHLATDLPSMIAAARKNPEAIVIGDRRLDNQLNVPGSSRFGRAFSDFWVWIETGQRLTDTQSGFRAYPVRLLPLSKLARRRYDFEIEVLVRSLWQGIRACHIPIGVVYPKDRVSHFHPWQDNFRLTILHTKLCTVRFFSLIFAVFGLRPSLKNARPSNERHGARILDFIARWGGLRLCFTLVDTVLPFYFWTGHAARRGIIGYYRRLGVSSGLWRRAYRNYRWFVFSMLDKVARAHKAQVAVESYDLEIAHQKFHGGAVLVGAHFGDWSFCGSALSSKIPVAVVLNPQFTAVFSKLAEAHAGLQVIDASQSGLAILLDVKKILDAGGLVCFLGDRAGGRTGTCQFLGAPAVFPLAPFEIATRLKVPLFDFYCLRARPGFAARYKVEANELWRPKPDEVSPPAQELLEHYVARLEERVRDKPEHWFNFFDFWAAPNGATS